MRNSRYLFLFLLALSSCGRFANKTEQAQAGERIVCLSKQYNEIIFALGAQQNLVAVDLSSTYPPEIKNLTTVGYHRALSAEGILSVKPTLIIHDNNVGPEQVMKQLQDLKIPMKVFDTKGEDIESAKTLVSEMGAYFHKDKQADSLNVMLDAKMAEALKNVEQYSDKPKVVIIHYGRANNVYLTLTRNSTGGKMIEWAGGIIPIEGDRGMQQLSAEIIAQADPDVILLTDFGYDRLGSPEQIQTLPGVASTKAAKANRIFRVEEHDMVYIGPRTGDNVLKLQQLIHKAQ
ncbi:MAG: ABC transporter substrate-binding protein [Cyclobacteriaceae bacterium]|nr:ABC transporter substrate-binding protein [Cyclobacteriaceae bacterium]